MPPTRLEGFLERYSRTVVSGWVRLPEGLTKLVLKIDGNVVADVQADQVRADLGGERVGFSIALLEEQTPAGVCTLEVCSEDSSAQVENSPVTVLLSGTDSGKYVLRGREGMLFLTNDTNRVVDQVTGQLRLSDTAKAEWITFAERLQEVAADAKFSPHFLVAPNKECVFERFLPEGLLMSAHRPLIDVLSCFASTWPNFFESWHYPLRSLRDQSTGPTYTPGDTHWTTIGSWIAVREMFGSEFPDLAARMTKEISAKPLRYSYENADLLSKLGGDCVERKPSVQLGKTGRIVEQNGQTNTGQATVWHDPDALSQRRVVVYHDSFGPSMFPYLCRMFGTVHTYWSHVVDTDELRRLEPDIVIVERVERFLTLPSQLVP